MILAYARVSTIDQAKNTSTESQIKKAKAIADLRGADAFEFQTYVDEGVSGSVPLNERPAGKQMLEVMQKGDVVIAAKLDRIFRSARDALNVVEEFKQKGVHLILIDMGTDPVTGGGIAKVLFTVLAAFAELERERIADRVQEGKRAKREKGGHAGGEAPYGWQIIGSGREARLEAIPAEQAVIQRIQSLSGTRGIYKYAKIRNKLVAEGMLNRAGKPWYTMQVKRILERVVQ